MHHDLTWSLNFLQAIEWHVVKVARTVQVSFLVPHHLLKENVPTRFSLLFLE